MQVRVLPGALGNNSITTRALISRLLPGVDIFWKKGIAMQYAENYSKTFIGMLSVAACCLGPIATTPAKISHTISVASPISGTFINYTAILEKMDSKGVTPENNAAIGILAPARQEVSQDYATWKKDHGKYVSIPNRRRMRELMHGLGLTGSWFSGPPFEGLQNYLKGHTTLPPGAPRGQGIVVGFPRNLNYADQIRSAAESLPWSAKEYSWLAGWIRRNNKALDEVVAAAHLRKFYCPLVPQRSVAGLWGVMLPYLGPVQGMGQALCVRAMLELHQHNFKACERDLLAAYRLARLITQPSVDGISQMVAYNIERRTCRADIAVANAGWFSTGEYQAYAASLAKLPHLVPLYATINTGDRFCCLDILQRLRSREFRGYLKGWQAALPKELYSHHWTKRDIATTIRITNLIVNRQVATMKHRDFIKRYRAYQKFMRWKSALLGTENRALPANVKWLLGWFNPGSSPRIVVLRARLAAKEELSRIALQLAAYRAAHGRYPKSLRALIPHYLTAIPKDPFTDQPIGYHRGRARVRIWTLRNFISLRHPPSLNARLRQFVTLTIPPGHYVWPKILPPGK
ncbi:MAG: hypothetical protein ACP5O1_04200 [Phycisphaerae bacterium]